MNRLVKKNKIGRWWKLATGCNQVEGKKINAA